MVPDPKASAAVAGARGGWNALRQLGDAAGYVHVCTVVDGGLLKCWGHNGFGQLGNGTNSNSNVPIDIIGL